MPILPRSDRPHRTRRRRLRPTRRTCRTRRTRGTRPSSAALRAGGLTLALILLAACASDGNNGDSDPGEGPTAPATEPDGTAPDGSTPDERPVRPQVDGTVTTGLAAPWGLDFLPNGDALVTQRDRGDVVRVTPDGDVEPVGEVPGVVAGGEGGLLGIAVSPEFDRDRFVYLYATTADDNRVLRMRLDGGRLRDAETLVDGIDRASVHNGGRIAFGPDGLLHVATGDAGDVSTAQDLDSLNGKILRMNADGSPPSDSPFGTLVHSYGHRNVQGLAWDDDGLLYASEFGQNTWDELNLIRAGGNYGWPLVEGHGADGTDAATGADGEGEDLVPPIAQWRTSIASPSGIALVRGTVLMAALRGERLWAVPVDGDESGEPRDLLVEEHGRLRTVAAAPDGSLWLVTNNTDGRGDAREGDDRILRLTY